MIIRKTLAAAATVGLLSLTGVGTAFAAPSTSQPGSSTTPQAHNRCQNADKRVDALQKRRADVEARLDKLNKALQYAKDHHDNNLVAKIESRIDRTTKVRDALTDRINKLVGLCHVMTSTPAPSNSPTTGG